MTLVPETAQLVLEVDLVALRRAPVLAVERDKAPASELALAVRLGLDPKRDLDLVLFAAASPDGGPRADAEFVLLVRGRIDRERVLAALGQRGELVKQREHGRELYTPRDGGGVSLAFLGEGLLAVVSAGWRERLLDRLEGRGRSVLEGRALGAELRAARRGRAAARLTSRLAPRLAAMLARLSRWPELAGLEVLSGSARADQRLELRLEAKLGDSRGAGALKLRLDELGRGSPAALQTRARDRSVELTVDLDRDLLRTLLSRLRL